MEKFLINLLVDWAVEWLSEVVTTVIDEVTGAISYIFNGSDIGQYLQKCYNDWENSEFLQALYPDLKDYIEYERNYYLSTHNDNPDDDLLVESDGKYTTDLEVAAKTLVDSQMRTEQIAKHTSVTVGISLTLGGIIFFFKIVTTAFNYSRAQFMKLFNGGEEK